MICIPALSIVDLTDLCSIVVYSEDPFGYDLNDLGKL